MNRLHKKCVITSAGLHTLLVLVLLFCPAFLTPKAKTSNAPPIDFIPSILIDGDFAGGGNPKANPPPAPAPAPPAPVAKQAPAPPPEPVKEPVKAATPPKPDVEAVEVVKPTARSKPQVDVSHPIIRRTPSPTSNETSAADTQERQRRELRERLASAFGRAANDIRSGTGSATKIDDDYGPGGGGPSYAGYGSWVRSVYQNAWVTPEDVSSDDATVEVKVTIASDGTVISRRITKRSGDPAVDASVQRALDRVTTVGRPFPEGAKDKERTYIIPFNLKTKRGAA